MTFVPETAEALAALLAEANAKAQSVALCGNSSKVRMGGPVSPADTNIRLTKLNRILQYEPRDLTISVEAGITYRELSRVLGEHRQMVPLDPPFSENATIGGIIATNCSGPRRRLYGTARDMVIGMTFATLDGKLIKTGGMVVKNVAGLDMGKLMIGSFGTLAAVAVVNFKLHPIPPATRTFVRSFSGINEAIAARDSVLKSMLQPAAIDLLKTNEGYDLAMQAGGSTAVLDRYSREFPDVRVIEGDDEQVLWDSIRERTPRFIAEHESGVVLRVSCMLSEVGTVMESLPYPAVARAGTGVCYGYFPRFEDVHRKGLIEFAPQQVRETAELWPKPGSDFAMMKKVKEMFDPLGLLNRGRLYGRI